MEMDNENDSFIIGVSDCQFQPFIALKASSFLVNHCKLYLQLLFSFYLFLFII
eukprot:m.9148 g.9148  ORF g.9148 m.9148 type:complete len:53 (-) comp6287_c0_seq1:192-350(-)